MIENKIGREISPSTILKDKRRRLIAQFSVDGNRREAVLIADFPVSKHCKRKVVFLIDSPFPQNDL
jgi:hypothetical protein